MTRHLALVALALAAGGCFFIHPRAPQPAPGSGEWSEVRAAETRGRQLYDRVTHRANAVATHLSPKVREARANRLADWMAWSSAELEARLAQDRAEAAAGEEFVISLYTADMFANDLDSPTSVWRVALVVEGVNVLPSKVESLEKDWTVKQLYPYVGPFDVVYRARFPLPPGGPLDGRSYVLRISSAIGTLDLDWSSQPSNAEGFEIVPPPAR